MSDLTSSSAQGMQGRAILMMIGAIFCFSLMDATVKALAPKLGVMPALWTRYAGQMLIVFVLVLPRLKTVARTEFPGLQLARSILLMCATGFFFWGLSLIRISDAAALMAVNPVLITLGAALFLGEKLGYRRLGGIFAALVGAMIIIRPGSDIFSPAALLPLCAAVCYSGYALLTRLVGHKEDVWTSLFYTGLVGTVLLSLVVPFKWQTPDASALVLMLLIAGFGTGGQLLLIRALSLGEAGMLAPYAYCGLIFAALWGVLFFGEWPGIWTVLGTLVIAAAGIYVWHRETYQR
ncbi:DMT family transporter [Aestuariivita boseongensis]|uniref:DMT family transporter n=1 Tax=Aestuariivita boseongensis TaxID=1470562 RepID=UPI000A5F1961|nr:DMT family transporter [Aestuariivita boseongensis]